MKINYNMSAYRAAKSLSKNETALSASTERLSSGFKINRAKDNPSGIAISRKMRSQIKGLDIASSNAATGVNIVETAEGALNEVHDMLKRINELSIKSANGTMSDGDRANVQAEVEKLKEEINRISETTQFNGNTLLDGSMGIKGYTNKPGIDVLDYNEKCKPGYYEVEFYVGAKLDSTGSLTGEYEILDPAKVKPAGSVAVNQSSETKYIHPVTGEEIEIKKIDKFNYSVDENGYDIEFVGDNDFAMILTVDGERLKDEINNIKTIDNLTVPVYDYSTAKYNDELVDFKILKIDTVVELKGYGGITMQIGSEEGQTLEMNLSAINTRTLKVDDLDVSTYGGAMKAIDASSKAIDQLSLYRARLGAYENRLNSTIASLNVTSENMTKSFATLTDTDMAMEMVDYTNHQVLVQAGTNMVAQANERPSQVLQLLQ